MGWRLRKPAVTAWVTTGADGVVPCTWLLLCAAVVCMHQVQPRSDHASMLAPGWSVGPACQQSPQPAAAGVAVLATAQHAGAWDGQLNPQGQGLTWVACLGWCWLGTSLPSCFTVCVSSLPTPGAAACLPAHLDTPGHAIVPVGAAYPSASCTDMWPPSRQTHSWCCRYVGAWLCLPPR